MRIVPIAAPLLVVSSLLAAVLAPAAAATLSKTYSYFSIGGRTLEDIQAELSKRGPKLLGSGARHPGATRMEFTSKVTYGEKDGVCRVADARVSVKAEVILPRWRQRARAEQDVRLIWDTLSADIKRHEESHIVIAKNHARELEDALKTLPRQRGCPKMAELVKTRSAAILEKHDREQARFDRIEGKGFERRILRLLEYRLRQIEAGRLPG